LDWADENYERAMIIAGNARKFALDHLNKKNVLSYLSAALQQPE